MAAEATAAEGWAEVAVGVRAAAAREVVATVAGSRCSIHRKSVGKHGDRGASAGAKRPGRCLMCGVTRWLTSAG